MLVFAQSDWRSGPILPQQFNPPSGQRDRTVAPDFLERRRIAALLSYDILQGPRSPLLDHIVRLAMSEFGTQSAAIVLVDRTTAIFQARVGTAARRCAREGWPCGVTIRSHAPLVVQDTRSDPRTSGLPAAVGAPMIRSYAGFPLITRDGLVIGTLAVFSREANRIPVARVDLGVRLAAMVMDALDLQRLASRDPLTGVLNRRGFMEQYERSLDECQADGKPLSLAMMDIDFFKPVNDKYGHGVGDQVLRAIAAAARHPDLSDLVVGRLGGEEFAFVLPQQAGDLAMRRIDGLRRAITELRFDEAPDLRVSASFGIAELGDKARNAAELLARADMALYQAKDQGRNRVVAAS